MAGRGADVDGAAVLEAPVQQEQGMPRDNGAAGEIATGIEDYLDGIAPDAGEGREDVLAMFDEPMEAEAGQGATGLGATGRGSAGAGPEEEREGRRGRPERAKPLVELDEIPPTDQHEERDQWLDDAREAIESGVEKVQEKLLEKAHLEAQRRIDVMERQRDKAIEEGRSGNARAIQKKIDRAEKAKAKLDDGFEKKLDTQQRREGEAIDKTERLETTRQRLDDADQSDERTTRAAEAGFRQIQSRAEQLSEQFERLNEEITRLQAVVGEETD
jgi:hypothetical protein